MEQFASTTSTIKDRLDSLAQEYAQRLQKTRAWAELPQNLQSAICDRALERIVASLETGDDTEFSQFVQDRAQKQLAQGFAAESLLQALVALEETLWPSVASVDAAKFLWSAFSQARAAVYDLQVEAGAADEKGEPRFLEGIVEDVTTRKQAEERIRQSQRTLQTLLDSMPFGVVIIDRDKRVRRANNVALALMGYESEDQVTGQVCHRTLCPAEADKCPILDFGNELDRSERILITKDGEHIPILKSVVSVTLDGQDVLLETFVDIAERKQTEEALLRLERAVEQSIDGIAVADMEGNIQFVNPAWAQMHGYGTEELLGQHLSVFHTEQQLQEDVVPFNEQVIEAGARQGQVGHVRKDGATFPTWMTVTLLKDERGSPVGLLATARDITERRQSEEALLRLERAVEQSIDGIAVADMEGNIQFVNPAWAQMHGYGTEELLGQHLSVFHTEQQLQEDVNPFNERVAEVGAHQGEVGHVRKDGATFPTWMTVTLLKDERGNPVGLLATARDITERKQAEETLQRERARTEALYEISRQLNAAGDEDEMFQVLVRPAQEAGAFVGNLLYIDLDEAGEPEWIEIVADWRQEGVPSSVPVGSRFYLPQFPITHLWLASPGEPQLIADVTTDERVDENTEKLLAQTGVRAMVIIPLSQHRTLGLGDQEHDTVAGLREPLPRPKSSVERRWVGLVTFSWNEPHEFSEQEVDVYRALIGLASPAVENRRLLVEKERALTETLYAISRGLSAASDEDDMLQVLTRPAREAGIGGANLLYIDLDEAGEPEWLEVAAAWRREGEPPMAVETRLYLPEFPLSRLWISSPDEPLLIADDATDTRMDEHTRNVMAQLGVAAMAVVPLTLAGRWVGLVTLNWDEPHEFSAREVEIYNALIGLASPAVESRRLFEQTQAALEEARIFRQLVEASGQAISMAAMDGGIVYANPALAHILSADTLEALLDQNIVAYYPQELLQRVQDEILPTAMERGEWMGELTLVSPQGQVIPTIQNIFLVRDDDGNPLYLANVITDITERKQTEEALRASEARFRDVALSMSDWMWEVDGQGRYTYCSERVVDVLGYTVEEMLGKTPFDLMPPDEAARVGEIFGQIAAHQQSIVDLENWNVRKDGRRVCLLTNGVPLLDQAGNLVGYRGVDKDITERKVAEAEMAERLQELDALHRARSGEGWAALRESAELPGGYLFDRTAVRPTGDLWLPEIGLAVEQEALVPPVTDRQGAEGTSGQAAAVAPLSVYGEIVGALGVYDDPQRPLSAEDLALVEAVSRQVAQALDGARLFEQAQTSRAQAEALYAGSERVVRATTLDDVLRALVDSTALQRLDRGSIIFFNRPWEDELPEEAIVVAAWEREAGAAVASLTGQESRSPVGTRYPLAQFPVIKDVTPDEPTIFYDIATDERVDGTMRALLDRLGMKSLILWPLVVGGQWIGFLNGQAGTAVEMTRDEIRHIDSLVDQASAVIQGIRLFEEAQARAHREQILRQVAARVGSAVDVDAVMRTAVQQVGQVLGRQAFIYVGDEVAGGDKVSRSDEVAGGDEVARSDEDRPHPAGLASLS